MQSVIENYLKQIETALKNGDATEHTHRPFLKTLIESLKAGITATNEPKRKGGNAPDFIVTENKVPIGYVETKDIGKPLEEIAGGEQLKRYRESFHNLILTDYLEFRWYVRGDLRDSIKLANKQTDGSLMICLDGEKDLLRILADFFETLIEIVTSPQELARRMANRARRLEESVEKLLTENNSEHLAALFETFRKELLPDLDFGKFADLYAQTVAYGLFTARVFTKNPPFDRQRAAAALPKTNPFLRRLFQQIAGFDLEDEPHVWAVDNLAKLLERADMSQILKNFGKQTRTEDAVVHFYETFLKEYNPTLRELRGVYYTPAPVVSYIVRSVDAILKRDFGLANGIADSSKIEPPRRWRDAEKINHKNSASQRLGGEKENQIHKVLILDPATGTGTFLSGVMDLIYQKFKREPAVWKKYVSEHLLPRIFGFELLVAPYSIAHLKLGLQLAETGYEFKDKERVHIFLTNTLEEVNRLASAQTKDLSYWINEEAAEANRVKQDAPVMVILGNPPYSGHSANTGEWIAKLLRGTDTHTGAATGNYFEIDGESLGEKNPKWLNNDYVKFIRFAQWRIEQTGFGILAFITSNSYLDSPTFRGMRQALMKTFDEIYILDLHGNSKKKEKAADGTADQNVFDITEGVNIGIFVKKQAVQSPNFSLNRASEAKREHAEAWTLNEAQVFHFDILGVREVFEQTETDKKQLVGGKYKYLRENDVTTTAWQTLAPQKPFYLFVPQNTDLLGEYQNGWKVTDIFPVNVLGFQTHRDHFAVDFDAQTLRSRIEEFRNTETSDDEIRRKYEVKDNRDWQVDKARKQLRADADWQSKFIKCLYRPFDKRPCFFDTSVMDYPRRELLDHVFGKENLCLGLGRQGIAIGDLEWQLIACSREPVDANIFRRGGINMFPLYLYPTERKSLFDETSGERRANLSEEFIAELATKLGIVQSSRFSVLPASETRRAQTKVWTLNAEDVFAYACAVFHSPTYRTRYAEFLKIDFPRLPLTSNRELFRKLTALGGELVKIHLLEKDLPQLAVYPADGDDKVENIRFEETADGTGKVWINKTQYFADVPLEVWNFHIGGYQVCQKWLKDRKGGILNFDDLMGDVSNFMLIERRM